MTIPITGDILADVLTLLAIAWVGAILLLPVGQWVAYKWDRRKYGKEQTDEIWRRMR
jgi:hypothetical protein